MPRHIEQKYRMVAAAPNAQDFLDFLTMLRDRISDIRNKISEPDSLDVRRATAAVLSEAIDKITRLRKDKDQRGRLADTDDDSPTGDEAEGDDLI